MARPSPSLFQTISLWYARWHTHPSRSSHHWMAVGAVTLVVAGFVVATWQSVSRGIDSLVVSSTYAQTTVIVDTTIRFQTIDGFGVEVGGVEWGSQNDWNAYSETTKQAFFDGLSGELGLSIIRHVVPWGESGPDGKPGNDNNDSWNTDMSKFDPARIAYRPGEEARGAYDGMVNTDIYAINELKKRGVNRFFMSAFAYPGWLLDGTCPANGHYGGNVDSAKLDEAAEYLYGVTRSFKERYNINFEAISLINEPEYCYRYSGVDLERFIPLVKNRFQCIGAPAGSNCVPISIKIMAPEHSHAEVSYTSYGISYNAHQYIQNIDIFGFHQYNFDAVTMQQNLSNLGAFSRQYGKPMWQVEAANGGVWNVDTLDEGIELANDVHNGLTLANSNVWLFFVDRHNDAPGAHNSPFRLFWMHPPDLSVSPKTYAFKKYTRYIPPDSVRVQVTGGLSDEQYCQASSSQPCISAYLHPDGTGITVVAVNNNTSSRSATFSFFGIPAPVLNRIQYAAPCVLTGTSSDYAGCDTVLASVTSGSSVSLPAKSVTTFTTLTPVPQGDTGSPWGGGGGGGVPDIPAGNKSPQKPIIRFCPGGNCPALPPKAACEDGIDNDTDGKIDHPADPGCSNAQDTDETDAQGPVCGNNQIESGEACDGTAAHNQTCQTRGFTGGTLACNAPGSANPCQFNTIQCTNPPPQDTTFPVFAPSGGFTATPVTTSGSVTLSWNVTDNTALDFVEITRAPYSTGIGSVLGVTDERSFWQKLWDFIISPTTAATTGTSCDESSKANCQWVVVKKEFAPNQNQTSWQGSFTDTTLTVGKWWYGIHAVDKAANRKTEPTPPGPVLVERVQGSTANPGCTGDCSAGTYVANTRYIHEVFSSVTTTKNVPYSQSLDEKGQMQTHLMDIYEPSGDAATNRPLIIWIHGGGFMEEGSEGNTKDNMTELPTAFAKRGYVTASINYRTRPGGVFGAPGGPLGATALQMRLEAQYDAEAAVRWFRCSALATNPSTSCFGVAAGTVKNKYKIDPTKIAMGGTSAGGGTSMMAGYNADNDLQNPRTNDNTSNAGYMAAILSVVDISGQPNEQTFEPGEPAIIIFHSLNDPTVPYILAQNAATVLQSKGMPYEFHTFSGSNHAQALYNANTSFMNVEIADFLQRHVVGMVPI